MDSKESCEHVAREVEEDLARFSQEVLEIIQQLVIPEKIDEFFGLKNALLGYTMGIFSRIDLYSYYWAGPKEKNQTKRMVRFMNEYLAPNTEAHTVAIKIWRHKLMHTSRPRTVKKEGEDVQYYWLLNWGHGQMPRGQHYTLPKIGGRRKLTIGVTYLIEDLKTMAKSYFSTVARDPKLQTNLSEARAKLKSDTVKINGA